MKPGPQTLIWTGYQSFSSGMTPNMKRKMRRQRKRGGWVWKCVHDVYDFWTAVYMKLCAFVNSLSVYVNQQGLQRRATPHPSELKVMKNVIEARRNEAYTAKPDEDLESPDSEVKANKGLNVSGYCWSVLHNTFVERLVCWFVYCLCSVTHFLRFSSWTDFLTFSFRIHWYKSEIIVPWWHIVQMQQNRPRP